MLKWLNHKNLVHAKGVGGAVDVRVLLDDARVVAERPVGQLVAVADATQVVQRGQARDVELEIGDVGAAENKFN